MDKPTCSKVDCQRARKARGLCATHYAYARRTGEIEMAEPVSDFDRFWSNVDAFGDCWNWTASATREGYGTFSVNGKNQGAHRYAWSTLVGNIPPLLHLDHLCRNTLCVNPDHLEPVTTRVNTLRGVGLSALNARKTHCKEGHPFTPENTGVYKRSNGTTYRGCRTCGRIKAAKRRMRTS